MAKDIKFNIRLNIDGRNVVVQASQSVKELQRNLMAARTGSQRLGDALIRFNQVARVYTNISDSLSTLSGVMGAPAKVHVYSRGGGFMVDARARGRRGAQYTNSAGATKPVLMWATEGTAVRGRTNWDSHKDNGHKRRRGAYRGRMPRYDIIDRAEAQSVSFVENDLQSEVEAAAWKRAGKMGM